MCGSILPLHHAPSFTDVIIQLLCHVTFFLLRPFLGSPLLSAPVSGLLDTLSHLPSLPLDSRTLRSHTQLLPGLSGSHAGCWIQRHLPVPMIWFKVVIYLGLPIPSTISSIWGIGYMSHFENVLIFRSQCKTKSCGWALAPTLSGYSTRSPIPRSSLSPTSF